MESKTIEFSKFINSNNKELTEFAKGLLLHEEPIGIDRFVHGNDGYAYVHGKKIQSQIKRYFPDEDSLKIAHSFIEFAVEMRFAEKYPQLQKELRQIIMKVNSKLDKLSEIFSEFFHTDPRLTNEKFLEYNHLLLTDISSKAKAVKFYTKITNKIRKTQIPERIIKELLDLSIKEIERDYESFLEEVIQKCKEDIAKNYPNLN